MAIPLGKQNDNYLSHAVLGSRPGKESLMIAVAAALQDGPYQRVPPQLN